MIICLACERQVHVRTWHWRASQLIQKKFWLHNFRKKDRIAWLLNTNRKLFHQRFHRLPFCTWHNATQEKICWRDTSNHSSRDLLAKGSLCSGSGSVPASKISAPPSASSWGDIWAPPSPSKRNLSIHSSSISSGSGISVAGCSTCVSGTSVVASSTHVAPQSSSGTTVTVRAEKAPMGRAALPASVVAPNFVCPLLPTLCSFGGAAPPVNFWLKRAVTASELARPTISWQGRKNASANPHHVEHRVTRGKALEKKHFRKMRQDNFFGWMQACCKAWTAFRLRLAALA